MRGVWRGVFVLVCTIGVGTAHTSVAAACNPCRPSITVSGPLTQSTVAQAVHPIPTQITSGSGIGGVIVSFDDRRVKELGPQPSPYVVDLGPYDATPAGAFAPGPHTIKIVAWNPVDEAPATKLLSFTIVGPTLSLSGALRALGGQMATPGSYDVNVAASPAVAGGPGIRRLELKVDGATVDAFDAPCNPSCGGFSRTFWFNTESLVAGSHSVEVVATDAAGNIGRQTWTFTADPRRTLFILDPPAALDDVVQAVAAAGARWIEFHHSGERDEGGFILGNQSPADGLQTYRDDYGDERGIGTLPVVSEFIVGGSIPTSALGSLAAKVVSREVVDPASSQGDATPDETDEMGTLYPDALMAEDAMYEEQGLDPRETGPAPPGAGGDLFALPEEYHKFAPAYGQINSYNWPTGRPRRISQTLTFPREAVGDVDGDGDKDESPFEVNFGLDHGYEHDLKLIDPDYHGSTKHPVCSNEKERFWAQRKGYTWWTTFPKKSHPYFDENVGDNCKFLDFTIGLEYPLQLSPGVTYSIRIRTRAGDRTTSRYKLLAQKTVRFCSTDPRYCSQTKSGGESQRLAGPREDVRTLECRRWRKGYNSRRTCDYLNG